MPAPRTPDSGDRPADDTPPADRPWAQADADERRVEGSGAHEAPVEGSGGHAVGDARTRGQDGSAETSGAHAALNRTEADPVVDDAGAADDLLAALGGFTGTLGATNTAGLLSGYTPPSGLALSATGSRATALIVETDESLALPAQRNGSGRWVAVSDDEEADEREPDAAPAPAVERVRSPAALVSIGGAAAAVAVVSTLFLWPAPRTTNSAISRPAPLVPAVTAPAEPTAELTPTPTLTTSHRPRPRRTDPAGRRATGRRDDDSRPEREHRADHADRIGVGLGTGGVGVDDADDHVDDQARGRLTAPSESVGAASISAGTPKGPVPNSKRALRGVAPTGFEPALPP